MWRAFDGNLGNRGKNEILWMAYYWFNEIFTRTYGGDW